MLRGHPSDDPKRVMGAAAAMRERKEGKKRTAAGRQTASGRRIRFTAAGILLPLLLAASLPTAARAKGLDGLRKLNESGPDAAAQQEQPQNAAETADDSANPVDQEQGQGAAGASDQPANTGDQEQTQGAAGKADKSAALEQQRAYLREALDRLRTLGITPDAVLADVQELISHTGEEPGEDTGAGAESGDTGSTEAAEADTDPSGTAEMTAEGAGDGQTASSADDSPAEGIRAAGSALQQSIAEAGESAKSAADQKIGEAAESVKKTAQEKAKEAVGAFFDNLFARIKGLLPF